MEFQHERTEVSYLTLILNARIQNISTLLMIYVLWCLNIYSTSMCFIYSHPHSHSGIDFIIILQLLRKVSRSSSVLYWGLPGKRIRRQDLDPKASLLSLFFSAKLGRPRGMGWGGRWEGGSGWGTRTSMADSCQCMSKTTTIL